MPTKPVETEHDNEDIFMNGLLKSYTFWKKKVREIEKLEKDATKERSYAEAFRVMINRFTLDTDTQDKKE